LFDGLGNGQKGGVDFLASCVATEAKAEAAAGFRGRAANGD
jgi:hypothetical protein